MTLDAGGGRRLGDAKAQGRNERQGGIPAYAGMTGGGGNDEEGVWDMGQATRDSRIFMRSRRRRVSASSCCSMRLQACMTVE